MTTIKTAEGVLEAGPDVPALAAATQREENSRAAAMEDLRSSDAIDQEWSSYLTRCGELGERPIERSVWQERTRAGGLVSAGSITADYIRPGSGPERWPGAPVGRVSPEQAGILPSGPMRVSDQMVNRALDVLTHAGDPISPAGVRAALEAALDTSR